MKCPWRVFLLICISGTVWVPGISAYDQPHQHGVKPIDRTAAVPARAVPEPRRAARERLARQLPGLRAEMDPIRGTPQHVRHPSRFLKRAGGGGGGGAAPVPGRAHGIVRDFLNENRDLFGYGEELLDQTRLTRDYTTGHNGLRTVVWEQDLDGIAVFGGVFIAHVSRDGDLVSVSSQVIPDRVEAAEAGTPGRRAQQERPAIPARRAVRIAAGALSEQLEEGGLEGLGAAPEGAGKRQGFRARGRRGPMDVQLVWLPTAVGEMCLCWEVELSRQVDGDLYRVLIDARTGEVLMLHRRTVNISEATYRVFAGDSPAPGSPGLDAPSNEQAAEVQRELRTWGALSTNASPTGWIPDGMNETVGNNVHAHLDRDGNNVADLPRPQGVPFRVFDPPLDLATDPVTYGDAAVVQLFYWCNWMHDTLHDLGFTEAAGNFQKDNFGRGGKGEDPVIADAQDGSGFNNANYTPTRDGTSPRIQMFVFNGPDPDRDGGMDAHIILHEYTHGLTDRLIGGGVGILFEQPAGMGEGWSDFYALALLSEEADDLHGSYPMGPYSTYELSGLEENYYYGIRRYPYSTRMDRNPLTYKDIDPTLADPHEGVPINPTRPFDPLDASLVHRQGEVWAVTLWDARANLIEKHGFAAGNRLILQLVTDGLKLSPPNPTFLQARDAILQADLVLSGGGNQADLWQAFAKRGMGVSASGPMNRSTIGVNEAFDTPDSLTIVPATALIFAGSPGGSIFPLCRTLTLTNRTAALVEWRSGAKPVWLEVTPGNGSLAPGESVEVSLCVNEIAGGLGVGAAQTAVIFTNLTSMRAVQRPVEMRMTGLADVPFFEGFEGGVLRSFWSVTGRGLHRTQITTNHVPFAGDRHLTMDGMAAGLPARNELSLGLDLEGYTNVTLRFWAREFDDSPDALVGTQFVDGADFDGVAISENGVVWHEVAGLRGLGGSDADVLVDLDAEIVRHGLSYNRSFRIRFNHYGNGSIPDEGFAIDDIAVNGHAPLRLVVTLPESLGEEVGTVMEAGVVGIEVVLTAPAAVSLVSSDPVVSVPATVVIPAGTNRVSFPVTVMDDTALGGPRTVEVVASAVGLGGGRGSLQVVDDEVATLTLSLPSSVAEGNGTVAGAGMIHIPIATGSAIPVSLTSSDPGELVVPAFVVIPPGQTSVGFNLTVVDDFEIDGEQTVIVTASVENWVGDIDVTRVMDNEQKALFVSLPALVSEAGGSGLTRGSVVLSGTLPTNLVVELSSSLPGDLSVPGVVTVPAGTATGNFDFVVVEDGDVEGVEVVGVTARADGFLTGQGVIRLHDSDSPPVPYGPDPAGDEDADPEMAALSWRLGVEEVIRNGGFETGDFTGWSMENVGAGDYVVTDGTFDPPGPVGPEPAYDGNYSVVNRQSGPGRHVLFQDITIPIHVQSAVLNWTQRIWNGADDFAEGHGFRVEVLGLLNDLLETPFSTGAGQTAAGGWEERSHDLSHLRGQTVRIAFVEEDALGFLNVGLDRVRLMVGFGEETSSEVYFSGQPVFVPADLIAVTSGTEAQSPTLGKGKTYHWQVVARRGAVRVPGPVWEFTTRGHGAVDHYEWGAIPERQILGEPILVTVTAKDRLGQTVTDAGGQLALAAERYVEASPVRILTFVRYTFLEREYRHTVGGMAVHFPGFVEETTTTIDPAALQAELADRDLFLVVAQPNATPEQIRELGPLWAEVLNRFVEGGGTVIVCSYFGQEHRILSDSGLLGIEKRSQDGLKELRRVGGGGLVEGVPELFSHRSISKFELLGEGDVLVETSEQAEPVVVSREVGAGLVVMMGTDFVTTRSPMDRILANVARSAQEGDRFAASIAPTVSGYLDQGVWSGLVAVNDIGRIRLLATDAAGRSAGSGVLEVEGVMDLGVEASTSGEGFRVGDELTLESRVTSSGPGDFSGVALTNSLSPGLTVLSVETPRGSCLVTGGVVICQLGGVSGGEEIAVRFHLRADAPGALGYRIEAGAESGDPYRLNNVASGDVRVTFPSLTLETAQAGEGDTGTTAMHFNVRLVPASPQVVTCDYFTRDRDAIAGVDYEAASGRVTFLPGETNRVVSVTILPDVLNELREVFEMNLSDPSNAVIAARQVLGIINDADPVPRLSVEDQSVVEGGGGETTVVRLDLGLSEASGRGVSVNFTTVAGSASPVLDYASQSGTVLFAPGQTHASVELTVVGDNLSETNETFTVRLSAPAGVELTRSEILIGIIDDDGSRLDHFDWSGIDPQQFFGSPMGVTITARDGSGRPVTDFAGTVVIEGLTGVREPEIPGVLSSWNYPMGTHYHDQRVQSIYLTNEIGGSGRITGLSMQVDAIPGQLLRRWTIRLRPTGLDRYGLGSWESVGWTVVYEADELIGTTGWVTFPFTIPFTYDGRENLMVDFSFDNPGYTTDGRVGAVTTAATRSLHFRTDSAFGDPRQWSGSSPPPQPVRMVPKVRFQMETPVTVSPAVSGSFVDGSWAGTVTMTEVVDGVSLRASDRAGTEGVSGVFDVAAVDDLALSVSGFPEQVSLGGEMVYRLWITNTGPAVAGNVVLSNWISPAALVHRATPTSGGCMIVGGVVVCDLGGFAAGQTGAVEIAATVVDGGLITNRVDLSRDGLEVYVANNRLELVAQISPPDLLVGDLVVTEGETGLREAVLELFLSHPASGTASVDYETMDLTAVAGKDYVAASGRVFFPPGIVNRQVPVAVIGDFIDEIDEQFVIRFRNLTNVTVLREEATITITDEDPEPVMSVEPVSVVEGNEGEPVVGVNFTLSEESGHLVYAVVETVEGTARAGSDYVSYSTFVAFPPGSRTRSIPVRLIADFVTEEEELFYVRARLPVRASLGVAEAAVTILDDDGLGGLLDHFAWSGLSALQFLGEPIPVRLEARDSGDNLVSRYDGAVAVKGRVGVEDVEIGKNTGTAFVPMGTGFEDSRSQVIYLAEEIGGPRRIRGLALEVSTVPGQPLSDWTIRLRHTALTSFPFSPTWEAEGWREVFRGEVVVASAGWVEFEFSEPFDYDGQSSLMVDFSFNNSYFTLDGRCRASATTSLRTIYSQQDSGFGDPRGWVDRGPPVPLGLNSVPRIRFMSGADVPVTPAFLAEFAGGVWTGEVVVGAVASNMVLRAEAPNGFLGISVPFDVAGSRDADGDGMDDAWEQAHFGSLTADPLGDPDGDRFSNRDEFRAGTDPLDGASRLVIVELDLRGGGVVVRFQTAAGRSYWVERAIEPGGAWTAVGGGIEGDGQTMEWVDPEGRVMESRYYRVVLAP